MNNLLISYHSNFESVVYLFDFDTLHFMNFKLILVNLFKNHMISLLISSSTWDSDWTGCWFHFYFNKVEGDFTFRFQFLLTNLYDSFLLKVIIDLLNYCFNHAFYLFHSLILFQISNLVFLNHLLLVNLTLYLLDTFIISLLLIFISFLLFVLAIEFNFLCFSIF